MDKRLECRPSWTSKRSTRQMNMKNGLSTIINPVKRNWLWIIANIVGIGIFLKMEARLCQPSSLNGTVEFIDIIDFICNWLNWECPLLIVFLLLNMIWLYRIIRQRHFNPCEPSLIVLLLICLAWIYASTIYGVATLMIAKVVPMLIKRVICRMTS